MNQRDIKVRLEEERLVLSRGVSNRLLDKLYAFVNNETHGRELELIQGHVNKNPALFLPQIEAFRESSKILKKLFGGGK